MKEEAKVGDVVTMNTMHRNYDDKEQTELQRGRNITMGVLQKIERPDTTNGKGLPNGIYHVKAEDNKIIKASSVSKVNDVDAEKFRKKNGVNEKLNSGIGDMLKDAKKVYTTEVAIDTSVDPVQVATYIAIAGTAAYLGLKGLVAKFLKKSPEKLEAIKKDASAKEIFKSLKNDETVKKLMQELSTGSLVYKYNMKTKDASARKAKIAELKKYIGEKLGNKNSQYLQKMFADLKNGKLSEALNIEMPSKERMEKLFQDAVSRGWKNTPSGKENFERIFGEIIKGQMEPVRSEAYPEAGKDLPGPAQLKDPSNTVKKWYDTYVVTLKKSGQKATVPFDKFKQMIMTPAMDEEVERMSDKTLKCPSCGAKVDSSDDKCPHCKEKLNVKEDKNQDRLEYHKNKIGAKKKKLTFKVPVIPKEIARSTINSFLTAKPLSEVIKVFTEWKKKYGDLKFGKQRFGAMNDMIYSTREETDKEFNARVHDLATSQTDSERLADQRKKAERRRLQQQLAKLK